MVLDNPYTDHVMNLSHFIPKKRMILYVPCMYVSIM